MNPIYTQALAEGATPLIVNGGLALMGIAGCWMGLKVSQVCQQKHDSSEGSWQQIAYTIGRAVSAIFAGIWGTFGLAMSAVGGLRLASNMSAIANHYLTASLKFPVFVTLVTLGGAITFVPTALCIVKLLQRYGFLSLHRT